MTECEDQRCTKEQYYLLVPPFMRGYLKVCKQHGANAKVKDPEAILLEINQPRVVR